VGYGQVWEVACVAFALCTVHNYLGLAVLSIFCIASCSIIFGISPCSLTAPAHFMPEQRHTMQCAVIPFTPSNMQYTHFESMAPTHIRTEVQAHVHEIALEHEIPLEHAHTHTHIHTNGFESAAFELSHGMKHGHARAHTHTHTTTYTLTQGFESAAFKLSHEMTQLLDPGANRSSATWAEFEELVVRGYLAVSECMHMCVNVCAFLRG